MPPGQPQAPSYQRVGCPVCQAWAKQEKEHQQEYRKYLFDHPELVKDSTPFSPPPLCTNCHKELPADGYEQGRVMAGFKSFTVNHYHFKDVAGVGARGAVMDRLCFECLLADWKVNYPDKEYGAGEE